MDKLRSPSVPMTQHAPAFRSGQSAVSGAARIDIAELPCRLIDWAPLDSLPVCDQLHLLGGMAVGETARTRTEAAIKNEVNLPLLPLVAPLLEQGRLECGELWFSRSPVTSGRVGAITYRCDGQMLYGVIDVDESDFANAGDAPPLQLAAAHAYQRIFALLDQLGYPCLWRVWNYLADINGGADSDEMLERYRQFNIGRYQAFSAAQRLTSGNVPAASALGVAKGPLCIAFLAGRDAPLSLENPRQLPAYEYPAAYGPRSPTFARATVVGLPGQELLFVSGTASIVGHATVHVGDVAAQTRETLNNIAAIVDEANRHSAAAAASWSTSDLSYRAYIRHAGDINEVHNACREILGERARMTFVGADVCRADLLVEVEAFATRFAASTRVAVTNSHQVVMP